MSCFLDPRFKADYINIVDVAMVKDRLVREDVEMLPKDIPPESPERNETSEPPPKKGKLGSWLKELKGTVNEADIPQSREERIKKEMESYPAEKTS